MFNWEKKNRLSEQLKFFNAAKKRFISCYAKKPRIRVSKKAKLDDVIYPGQAFINPRYDIRSAQQAVHRQNILFANLSAQNQANTSNIQSFGMLGAANLAARQQVIGIQAASDFTRQGMESARNDILSMFGSIR